MVTMTLIPLDSPCGPPNPTTLGLQPSTQYDKGSNRDDLWPSEILVSPDRACDVIAECTVLHKIAGLRKESPPKWLLMLTGKMLPSSQTTLMAHSLGSNILQVFSFNFWI